MSDLPLNHPDDFDWKAGEEPPLQRRAHGRWRLPITNVAIDEEGRLTFLGRAPLGPGEVNEGWWESVMDDPRSRRRRIRGSWDTINRYPDMMFTAHCEKCSLDKTVSTNELLERYGPETPVNQIAIDMAGTCSTRTKWCKLRKFIRLPSGASHER